MATGTPAPTAAAGLDAYQDGAASGARRRALVFTFALSLLGLVLVALQSYRTTVGLVDAADRLRDAERIRGAVVRLLTALLDVGAGARGFALSGDESYLETMREGAAQTRAWIAELERAGADDSSVVSGLATLRPLVAERIALADEVVALRREAGSAADPRLTPTLARAKANMDRARGILQSLDEAESREIAARTEALSQRQRQMGPAIAALVAVGLLLLLGVVWAVRRETAAMRRAQQTLRTFLDAAPDASVMVDGEGKIVFANTRATTFFGWPRAELLGQPIEVLVPERVRGGHVAQRMRYTADPQPRPMGAGLELNARRRDGSEVAVEISLSPIATVSGRFITAAVRDITERRQATERLREARAWADSLVETVREPLVVLDGALRVLRANRAFHRFFGVSPRAIVGVSLFELAGGQWDVPGLRAALADLLPRRTVLDGFELDQDVAGRGRRSLLLHARPVERDETGADAILIAIEDVTERKHNERLLVERRALERVNADLQEFAYAASHDLQEPLRKIRTFGDRVLQRWGGSVPEEGRDYLQRMQNAAARMQKLIDDLLAFSRVSTRAQPFEQVDLAALAGDVVQRSSCDAPTRPAGRPSSGCGRASDWPIWEP